MGRQRELTAERDALVILPMLDVGPQTNAALVMALMQGPVTVTGRRRLDNAVRRARDSGARIVHCSMDRSGILHYEKRDHGWKALATDNRVLCSVQRQSDERNYHEQIRNWRVIRCSLDVEPNDPYLVQRMRELERLIFDLSQNTGRSTLDIAADMAVIPLAVAVA